MLKVQGNSLRTAQQQGWGRGRTTGNNQKNAPRLDITDEDNFTGKLYMWDME